MSIDLENCASFLPDVMVAVLAIAQWPSRFFLCLLVNRSNVRRTLRGEDDTVRMFVRIALHSHDECCVWRTILSMSLDIVYFVFGVRYGTVMFTGRHSGMLGMDAMCWTSRFNMAAWA